MPRDGPVWSDDPTKTKMANCVEHMRHHPTYMPPNTWPDGMLLFGFQATPAAEYYQIRPVATVIVPLRQFEDATVGELFGWIDPQANLILFMPSVVMATDQQHGELLIDGIYANNDMQQVFAYLHENGWELWKEGVAV